MSAIKCPECGEDAKQYSCTSMEGLYFCTGIKCSAVFSKKQQDIINKLLKLMQGWRSYAWHNDSYVDDIQDYFDEEVQKIIKQKTGEHLNDSR
jgi:hypothetical protein